MRDTLSTNGEHLRVAEVKSFPAIPKSMRSVNGNRNGANFKKGSVLLVCTIGRRTHHPRLDSFVHNVQKPPRERAKRAFMPMGRFALSPPKERKVFPKRPNRLGGARVPTHFHRFFSSLYQKTAEFLFFPTVPDL